MIKIRWKWLKLGENDQIRGLMIKLGLQWLVPKKNCKRI